MPRKMRDSGVEWIGQVPEGWGIRRFKFVSTALRKGCGITKDQVFDDGDVPCVRYGEIYSKYINAFDRCQSKTRREFVPEPVYVSKGDILFACTGELVEEIGKNILYNGELPCVAGGDILVASHKQNAAFLNYYLNCHTSQFQKSRGKTKLKVVHARTSDIGNLLVLLPPMPEQERIAAYLDARCGEIDAAVAAARQSIEDYKALKKSLVFEAVTGKRKVEGKSKLRGEVEGGNGRGERVERGEGEMCDSGVAWIGQVPEGWRTTRLRYLCSITTGDHDTQDADPDGIYPFYVRSPIIEHSRDYTFDGLGILMAGDGAGAGRVFHLADGKYAVHQRVYRFYDFREVGARYLWYFLGATFPFVMDGGSAKSTVPSVRLPMLTDHVVLYPNALMQNLIADCLDAKCGAIDALVAEKESLIADLEQYKKSLIFECVTGKREVA